jgi:hypothetical protein
MMMSIVVWKSKGRLKKVFSFLIFIYIVTWIHTYIHV